MNFIAIGADVPVEHAHQDMEGGGLGVESTGAKAGAGVSGDSGFPRQDGLLAGGQGICSLESLRNLADIPVEHVHFEGRKLQSVCHVVGDPKVSQAGISSVQGRMFHLNMYTGIWKSAAGVWAGSKRSWIAR